MMQACYEPEKKIENSTAGKIHNFLNI